MRQIMLFVLYLCIGVSVWAQPLTQREACSKFGDAVVSIDAGGGESRGSGFLVSADGFILTAAHVVRDVDGGIHPTIDVALHDGSHLLADPVLQSITADNTGKDFVLLKIRNNKPLPFLKLGSIHDVAVGADATIIGFPFSALSVTGSQINKRFCLTASFAATDQVSMPISWMPQRTAIPIDLNIKVDVIYFQGPSVKGVSGSPIIARDTGVVVGIVTTKLTGIGPALGELSRQIDAGLGERAAINGLVPGTAVKTIITVLDQQLANGLGSATGIDAAEDALYKIQHQKKR